MKDVIQVRNVFYGFETVIIENSVLLQNHVALLEDHNWSKQVNQWKEKFFL